MIPAPLDAEGRFYLRDTMPGRARTKSKPNKSVAKRFKVTKTGKVKRHHSFTSHLMSARPAKKRRNLRKPAIVSEGLARNMRRLMGAEGLRPNQIAHERRLAAAKKAAEAQPAA
jgi:large subunit ribosomal protein L35